MSLIKNTPEFDSYLTQNIHKPNQGIINFLNNKRTPFNNNILFSYNPAFLGAKEWNRCVDFFLDKTPNGTMMHLMNVMRTMAEDEHPHIKELEELAVSIVSDMYNVPKDILMKPKIGNVDSDDLGCDNDEKEELTDEQKEKIEPYIQKRIILNSLMHGAAIHQWTSAFYLGYEELNELNPDLIEHYNTYASLINYFNWKHDMALMSEEVFNNSFGLNGNTQGGGITQGYNKVDIEKREIEAVGINFPVLIHELSKGALEYLLSRGIPSDLEEEELLYLYEKADNYSHEFWHYYMGPTLWRALIQSADVNTQDLPAILSYISTLEYEELANLFLKITFDSDDEGKKIINKIKKQIQYESN